MNINVLTDFSMMSSDTVLGSNLWYTWNSERDDKRVWFLKTGAGGRGGSTGVPCVGWLVVDGSAWPAVEGSVWPMVEGSIWLVVDGSVGIAVWSVVDGVGSVLASWGWGVASFCDWTGSIAWDSTVSLFCDSTGVGVGVGAGARVGVASEWEGWGATSTGCTTGSVTFFASCAALPY